VSPTGRACGFPRSFRSRYPISTPNFYQFVGDYSNPILKPEAAEVVKKHGEISLTGVTYPTPGNQCWPEGVPFVFANMGMQLLQQPHQITILYSYDHEVRRVRMNQLHPAWGSRSGRLPWSTCTARRTARRYTWWNVIACSITNPPKKRKNGAEKRMASLQETGTRP
jgi:hypothetical protein